MGDTEEADAEVFEITDFTTASDWERFVGALTELLHEWRASATPEDDSQAKGPAQRHATVDFAGYGFKVTFVERPSAGERRPAGPEAVPTEGADPLPAAMAEISSGEADFAPAHPVSEAFGVGRFVVLEPATEPGVNSASKARLLLSSLHLALRDTGWDIPMFVQVHRPAQLFFLGACVGDSSMTEFQTILLKRAPPQLYHLSGLLELLKGKLAASSLPPVRVSVRLQYCIDEFGPATYCGQAADPADLETVLPPVSTLKKLPLDSAGGYDPIAVLELSACWHQVAETLLVEDDFSRLSPLSAPRWTLRLRPAARPVGLLGLCLRDVWQLCHRLDTFEHLVGRPLSDAPPTGRAPHVAAALSRLTEGRRAAAGPGEPAQPTDETSEYVDTLCSQIFNCEANLPPPALPAMLPKPVKDRLSEVKSCRPGDLLWRLAQVVCVLARSRATSLLCRLWERFLQQLRHHWDTSQPVPGVAEGSPDFGTTLLHQQLQMLNCCIQKRAHGLKTAKDAADEPDMEKDDADEDEEFFDAAEEGSETELDSPPPRRLPWNQPEGRLRACGSLRLREIREPLYIPVTQEVAPMTEDRLQEQSEVLVSLGTDPEGCQLRARMMAASLTSDMEAFKAANPGCTLGDFVRWYSPRDWEQEGDDDSGKGGELSARMRLPDNLWVETWSACKPVPAHRQRRLFDETREAERLLHQLSALPPAQLVQRLAPIIYRAAIYRLSEELEVPDLVAVGARLEEATKRLHAAAKLDWEPRAYEAVGELLSRCEHYILRRRSLLLKLGGAGAENLEFVQRLIGGAELPVPGGAHGDIAKQLERMLRANTPDESFPEPARKEYILRAACRRPGPGSRLLPQRLRALVTPDQFRVTTALSSDTCIS